MAYTIKRIAWALVIALFVLLAFMIFPGVPDRGDTGKGTMKAVAKDNVNGRRGEAVNSNGNLAAEGIRATEDVFAAIGEHMDGVTKTLRVELHEATLKAAEELRHQAETEALTREAAARFEQLSGKPQIVCGKVSVPSTKAYSGCITQVSVESEFGSPSEAVLLLYRRDECGEVTGRIEGAIAMEAGEMLAVRAVNDHGLTQAYAVVPVANEFSLKMIPPGRYQIVASTINRMGHPLRSVAEVTAIVSPNTVVDVKLLFK